MRVLVLLSAGLALATATASSQSPPPVERVAASPSYCAGLAKGRSGSELKPLVSGCKFAQSLRETLPNFVCEQTVTRTRRSPAGYDVTQDVIQATVTYEDGRERYGAVTVNGRPTEQEISAVSGGPNTLGEFGSFLAGVFSPESKAEFTARAAADSNAAFQVFDFRIKQGNNHWWVVRDSKREVYPEIEGSVTLDGGSRLVALQLAAANMPADFPVTSAKLAITYGT